MKSFNHKSKSYIELLAPAGSFAVMQAAADAGADAVYVSGKRFGARAFAPNFSEEELLEAIDYLHLRDCRLHLTVNTLMKEAELDEGLYRYLEPLVSAGLDAVIVQDLGVLYLLRSWFPELPVHASTQMSVTSREGAALLKRAGADRVILARELSLSEIASVSSVEGLEVETFIHGAMCYAYSGKCLFSSTLGERSGNRGTCAQPCRLAYSVSEDTDPQYLLSMQDLCTLDKIPQLISAGVSSFKIEGRMKDSDYVASVTALYRKYLDRSLKDDGINTHYDVSRKDRAEAKAYARAICGPGYLETRNGPDMITPGDPSYRTKEKGNASFVSRTASYPKKLPVTASLVIHIGDPAVLKLSARGKTVTVSSSDAAEKAQKAPLDPEMVRTRMEKTDKWPFALQWEEVLLDGHVFLPVSQMNSMRRQAFCDLAKELTEPYRRSTSIKGSENIQAASELYCKHTCEKTDAIQAKKEKIHALATTEEQITALLSEPVVGRIYIESTLVRDDTPWEQWIAHAHSGDYRQEIMIALPHIYRPQGEPVYVPPIFGKDHLLLRKFDGILVRALDELAWLTEKDIRVPLYTDYMLYAFNSAGVVFLGERGVKGICYSPEMSRYEIADVEKSIAEYAVCPDREVFAYGKQIRMLSAQCIVKNTGSCLHQPGSLLLTDRRGAKFIVQNRCDSCYNILYNTVPVSLHDALSQLSVTDRLYLRMDFTDESAEEVAGVISLFSKNGTGSCDYEYTKGHFERSVI